MMSLLKTRIAFSGHTRHEEETMKRPESGDEEWGRRRPKNGDEEKRKAETSHTDIVVEDTGRSFVARKHQAPGHSLMRAFFPFSSPVFY